jgi:ribosomal-protein-alanine acetyltransferase
VSVVDRLTVVPATPGDVAAIRALPGLGAVTGRLLPGHLADRRTRALLARHPDDAEVVGFLTATVGAGEAHVLDVVVHPDHRDRGVGRRLVTELLERLADEGVTDVTLEVRPSNAPGLALYRRCGFVVEGRRPRYYPDGEDAVLMWRR